MARSEKNVASPKKTISKAVAAPSRVKQTAASTPALKEKVSPAKKNTPSKVSRDPVLAEGGTSLKGKRRVIQSSKLSDTDYFYDPRTTPQARCCRTMSNPHGSFLFGMVLAAISQPVQAACLLVAGRSAGGSSEDFDETSECKP
jgi:hypothetical protein